MRTTWPRDVFTISPESFSQPLKLEYAIRTYNAASVCYLLAPPHPLMIEKGADRLSWSNNGALVIGEVSWFQEAFDHWVASAGEDTTCDNKNPFAPAALPVEEQSRFCDWVGLTIPSTLNQTQARQAQGRDLTDLFERHRRLCNLVEQRIKQPPDSHDEDELSDFPPRREQLTLPIVSPTFRAVLLITTNTMKAERRVLVVLNGDNVSLLSGAPTFASIPTAQVFAYRGDNAVEVSLKTAMEYSRRLDEKEEQANEVLRGITKTRFRDVVAMQYKQAGEKLGMWAEVCNGKVTTDYQLYDRDVEAAVRKVLDRKCIS